MLLRLKTIDMAARKRNPKILKRIEYTQIYRKITKKYYIILINNIFRARGKILQKY